jgi:hypothetical protein
MPQPFADPFKSIPMSSTLGESLERAHGFAREQGHRLVTLEHLLLAFTEDTDASGVLQASSVDLLRLGTDVSGYLGRLLEDMRAENGAEPTTDPELLRVLQAAVQAAQQSRRRQIDGAIVLAAVVGDGKSPAAGLLKAHGLTFEEVIRALQKTSAKANAQARSKQFATPAAVPAPRVSAPSENGALTLSPQSGVSEPANGTQGAGQSVEDILAAARARIQQRTTAIVGKSAEAAQTPPPPADLEPSQRSSPDIAAEPASSPATQANELYDEAPLSPPAPPAPAPSLPSAPPPPASRLPPSWTPPASAAPGPPPSARLPQAPPQRPMAPLPQRPSQQGGGLPRPPLPNRAGPGSRRPPQPGLPNRPSRAPWPDGNEPASSARPPMANGEPIEAPAATARRPGQRTGGQAGHGPLVETIPRRMRVGVPAAAQVRISRDRIDGLILLLMKGRGMAHRPETLITRALSVRLRAPDGGFWIEAASPETQWIETASSLPQDEQVTWRWTVTPQRRGRGRLILVVAARAVGHDGLATETAPPDRVIEIAVTGGRLRRLAGWGGFLAALILGAMLGRFGGEFWALSTAIIRRLTDG